MPLFRTEWRAKIAGGKVSGAYGQRKEKALQRKKGSECLRGRKRWFYPRGYSDF